MAICSWHMAKVLRCVLVHVHYYSLFFPSLAEQQSPALTYNSTKTVTKRQRNSEAKKGVSDSVSCSNAKFLFHMTFSHFDSMNYPGESQKEGQKVGSSILIMHLAQSQSCCLGQKQSFRLILICIQMTVRDSRCSSQKLSAHRKVLGSIIRGKKVPYHGHFPASLAYPKDSLND